MSKAVTVIEIDTGDPDTELDVAWGPLYGPGWMTLTADETDWRGSNETATAKMNIEGVQQLRDACDKFLRECDHES